MTPNAQESEDSGVSLSYSLVSNDVARRIQHPAKDEKDRDDVISERDNYDDQINAYRANTNKVKSLKDDFRCVLPRRFRSILKPSLIGLIFPPVINLLG